MGLGVRSAMGLCDKPAFGAKRGSRRRDRDACGGRRAGLSRRLASQPTDRRLRDYVYTGHDVLATASRQDRWPGRRPRVVALVIAASASAASVEPLSELIPNGITGLRTCREMRADGEEQACAARLDAAVREQKQESGESVLGVPRLQIGRLISSAPDWSGCRRVAPELSGPSTASAVQIAQPRASSW